jgi:hypothetical protein
VDIDDEDLVQAYERLRSIPRVADELDMPQSTVQYRLSKIRDKYPLMASRLFDAGLKSPMRHNDLIPWKVETEHKMAQPAAMLRIISSLRAGRPVKNDAKRRDGEAFEAMLRETNQVVAYDPEAGFRLVPRLPEDDDIIRKP